MDKMNIAILIGGKSVEHDISILSGLQVYNALDDTKYHKEIIYITKDNKILVGKTLTEIKTYQLNNFKKTKEITIKSENHKLVYKKGWKKHYIDLIIPAVHGDGTEDGTISAMLTFHNIAYITSDLISSAIAQDKGYTKDILNNYQIKTPTYLTLNRNTCLSDQLAQIEEKFVYPVIIKPARLGSSIGITVACESNIKDALLEAYKYNNRIIVEKYIKNHQEFNCAAFKERTHILTSAIEEVKAEKDILTFIDKYTKPLNKLDDATNRIIPAIISEELEETIQKMTKKIYSILNMKGVVRIDYLYDIDDKIVYFNEINTIPGSYAFYLFDKVGINFTELLDRLIKTTLLEKNHYLVKTFSSNVLSNKTNKLK